MFCVFNCVIIQFIEPLLAYLFLFVADLVCIHNHKEVGESLDNLKGGLGVGKASTIRISWSLE